MKTKSSFVIILIVSFLFSQEEIIHISKTHRDGTPKEVIIYEIVNDDLQSNNPFIIVEKISYDSKGNYVKPKISKNRGRVNLSTKEAINYENSLTKRSGVWYTKDTNKPYSGEVFSLWDNGKMKTEGSLKDGKEEGKWKSWHDNGQRAGEGYFKDGKPDGKWSYWEDDPPYWKITTGAYKDGNRVGKWTTYNKDGSVREVKEY